MELIKRDVYVFQESLILVSSLINFNSVLVKKEYQ